jgi:hypothetical protein
MIAKFSRKQPGCCECRREIGGQRSGRWLRPVARWRLALCCQASCQAPYLGSEDVSRDIRRQYMCFMGKGIMFTVSCSSPCNMTESS